MKRIRLAIVGVGKIARDQHLPALTSNERFELVAVAHPAAPLPGIPNFPDLPSLLETVPGVDAISICTPPQVRYAIAMHALEHGCHVMLEKPHCSSVAEVLKLIELAKRKGLALFGSLHAREAPAVRAVKTWLTDRPVLDAWIDWKEDVRIWHPGQTWIWRDGGFGVFDPGINALSLITHIVPSPIELKDAELFVPSNCSTPIAANLVLRVADATIRVALDFRSSERDVWEIGLRTQDGEALLFEGGSKLRIGGGLLESEPASAYARLYEHFGSLIDSHLVDVDMRPLRLAEEALTRGHRHVIKAYSE